MASHIQYLSNILVPIIRLVTDDDMRAIDSRSLARIDDLPHLYIPVESVDVGLTEEESRATGAGSMRRWGIARDTRMEHAGRQFPDALVAPRYLGAIVERGELLDNGAEPAADFLPRK